MSLLRPILTRFIITLYNVIFGHFLYSKFKTNVKLCIHFSIYVYIRQTATTGIQTHVLMSAQNIVLELCSSCLYWIVSKLKLEWLQPFVSINHFIPIKNYHQLPAYFVLMHLWESWLPKQKRKSVLLIHFQIKLLNGYKLI